MRALRRFRALPPHERRLLLEAGLILATARVALSLLPFTAVRRLVQRLGRARPGSTSTSTGSPGETRVVWAVEAADRAVPRSTCLVRALAAQALLTRYGHPSELRLGVARGPNGALRAHAWLEREGRVLIGAVTEHYVPMPPLAGSR